MTRTGKIARLPLFIRNLLNKQLQNGRPGTHLVPWLNSLPEVKSILAAQFGGQPISAANLSEWKKGGYRDWEAQKQATHDALFSLKGAAEQAQTADGTITDQLRAICAVRLALDLQRIDALEDSPDKRAQWRIWFGQVALLCQGDRSAEWVQLQREQLQFQIDNSLPAREKQFWEWAKKKENRVAFGRENPLTEEQKQRRIREVLGIGPEYAQSPLSSPPAQTATNEASDDPKSSQIKPIQGSSSSSSLPLPPAAII